LIIIFPFNKDAETTKKLLWKNFGF
jgi:hypothetical protein